MCAFLSPTSILTNRLCFQNNGASAPLDSTARWHLVGTAVGNQLFVAEKQDGQTEHVGGCGGSWGVRGWGGWTAWMGLDVVVLGGGGGGGGGVTDVRGMVQA